MKIYLRNESPHCNFVITIINIALNYLYQFLSSYNTLSQVTTKIFYGIKSDSLTNFIDKNKFLKQFLKYL